jgi:hypothetical protein
MSEQNKPFVITDRRKFTSDGTPRPDADPSPERDPREVSESAEPQHRPAEPIEFKSPHAAAPEPPAAEPPVASPLDPRLPPPPSASDIEQARLAYKQTTDHLETAVRAANPGVDHPPPMSFPQIVQSIYMTAVMQLGGGTPAGQQPKIDLMGARQSIDMLSVIADKTIGNLTPAESQLMDTVLFEIRMGFLEVTQALTRSAARNPPPPGAGPIPPGRPTIVR